jgi:hypothetical protein
MYPVTLFGENVSPTGLKTRSGLYGRLGIAMRSSTNLLGRLREVYYFGDALMGTKLTSGGSTVASATSIHALKSAYSYSSCLAGGHSNGSSAQTNPKINHGRWIEKKNPRAPSGPPDVTAASGFPETVSLPCKRP